MGNPDFMWGKKLHHGICMGVDMEFDGVKKYVMLNNWNLAMMQFKAVADYLATKVTPGGKPGGHLSQNFGLTHGCSYLKVFITCHGLPGNQSVIT